jgi:transcription-repair coupling factor (superfamily II helicase)
MTDRFGPIPDVVKRLIFAATLRYYASYALFERIIMQSENVIIILPKGENEDYYKFRFPGLMKFIVKHYNNEIKFEQKKGPPPARQEIMRLLINNNFESPNKLLHYLVEFTTRVSNLIAETNSEPKQVNETIN